MLIAFWWTWNFIEMSQKKETNILCHFQSTCIICIPHSPCLTRNLYSYWIVAFIEFKRTASGDSNQAEWEQKIDRRMKRESALKNSKRSFKLTTKMWIDTIPICQISWKWKSRTILQMSFSSLSISFALRFLCVTHPNINTKC